MFCSLENNMKLKIRILTGSVFEVQVDEKSTILDIKREIFLSGKTREAVRILKDSAILPDGDTLAQHKIQDGDTVSIVIEPGKRIKITVNYEYKFSGKKTTNYELSNITPVKKIKELVTKEMNIPEAEFKLVKFGKDEITLSDANLPLHFFGINGDSELFVVKTIVARYIYNQKGDCLVMDLPLDGTVADLRQRVLKLLSDSGRHVDSITIFYLNSLGEYQKLSADETALENTETFWILENRFAKRGINIRNHNWFEGEQNFCIHGIEAGDTVLSLKLRAQDQLGVPWQTIQLKTCHVNRKASDLNAFTPNDFGGLYNVPRLTVCAENDIIENSAIYEICSLEIPGSFRDGAAQHYGSGSFWSDCT